MQGQGKLVLPDGSVYVGLWEDDLYHGDGEWHEKNATATETSNMPRVREVSNLVY